MIDKIKFSSSDILDWNYAIIYQNALAVRPWLFHNHGCVICVVWAECLQDAFDEAVDAGKMEAYRIDSENFKDYGDTEEEQWENMSSMGNEGKPHDIHNIDIIEIDPVDFWNQFNAVEYSA